MSGHAEAPHFWRVVWLLLAASRRRAVGRQKRQAELFRQRAGKTGAGNWAGVAIVMAAVLMAGLNIVGAFVIRNAVTAAERSDAERQGWVVVDKPFADRVAKVELRAKAQSWDQAAIDRALARAYRGESQQIAQFYGGDANAIAQRLRQSVQTHGTANLRPLHDAAPGLAALPAAASLPALVGGLGLFGWALMLVFQGEGLDLDTQRRRHPMWEFLFSHPVPPGAVFLADMLAPIAANPLFFSAPLFPAFLYGFVYGPAAGALAAVVVGVPVTIAAACMGKALEIAIMLRFSPRSRGAILGLTGWLGGVAMMIFILLPFATGNVVTAAAGALAPLAALPWPWLGLFLGQIGPAAFSFPLGMLTCWVAAGLAIALSVRFSLWGAQRGLAGQAGTSTPAVRPTGAGFGKNGLYRKEFLWLMRDRGAIVQAILIPLSAASFQLFNMRGLLAMAPTHWNFLCGAGIVFGVYFLGVLGPRSLASEGSALWIALTWPQGLESILKAKAWLWSLIATFIVGLVLCYAAFLFPASAWKIGLVGAGWFLFARSLAEKTVTLANVTSESGEIQKISQGRRMATQLGTFTFSIGVLTQQWTVAIMGIVYSMMTSAAMWQNFRARLPYFYDPWSEEMPRPPTLMHAMIAISILVECGTVFTAIPMAFVGRDTIAVARAISYGVWAAIIAGAVSWFLARRGVSQAEIWYWAPGRNGRRHFAAAVVAGAGFGLCLSLFALLYLALLRHIPQAAEILSESQKSIAAIPHMRLGLFIMAVLIAPFAEEFLFRGLLYRALDREWGGWRAVAGSAAFFAMYHPFLSWLPVGLLGAANALVFKKTGRLAPAVALHMVYNAVVLS
jgi:membrane protease YdiL (CAAX protease family)